MLDENETLPEQCDVVVIGAGAGGLTSAALLAKAGLQTVVCEAESQAGGYLAGFQRQGFSFNSSVEWLNQCGPGGLVDTLFRHLGDPPVCPPLRRIRRFKNEHHDYLLGNAPDELRDRLIRDFPAAASGIRAFFADAAHLGSHLRLLDSRNMGFETLPPLQRLLERLRMLRWSLPVIRYVRTPVEKGLQDYFGDSEVKQLFCSQESLMAVMVSLAWAYSGDVQACPQGGSAALADWLAARIATGGGQIALRQRVSRVLLDGAGRAAGVQLEDGRRIAARYVIAACESQTLYERMLPDGAVPARLRQALQQADRQHSCFNVFLGLDCDPARFGLGEEALQLTRSELRRCEHSSGDPHRSLITLLAPSLRDPSLAPPGAGTLIVHIPARFADHDHWATGPNLERGTAYRQLKIELADVLLDRVTAAVAPRLREHIVVKEIATPLTYWRYTGNLHGSISGVMPTGRNIRARVACQQTPVKRLLLGGHCAVYGGGVPMAVRSGANAALIVLHDLAPAGYAELKGVMTGRKT